MNWEKIFMVVGILSMINFVILVVFGILAGCIDNSILWTLFLVWAVICLANAVIGYVAMFKQ